MDQPVASGSSSRLARLEALGARGAAAPAQSDGVIALQVVPYRP